MPHPSIEKSNQLHCNALFLGTSTDEKTTGVEVTREGENRIYYSREGLFVSGDAGGTGRLAVYTLDGRMAMQCDVSLDEVGHRVDIGMLRAGTYVARIAAAHGVVGSCKFVKK